MILVISQIKEKNMKHIIYISIIFSMMVAPVLAQTQSHLCNLFKINGSTYPATSITLKDNATQLAIEDKIIANIPTQHPQDEIPITLDGKAIYCVAGTLTADLVKEAASTGQFIIYGSINHNDRNYIRSYTNGAKSIKFINIDGEQVTSLQQILDESEASSVTFENCNFSKVWTLLNAFSNMSNLTSFSFKGMGLTNKLTELRFMFFSCKKLESVDFCNCDFSSVNNLYSMFSNCSALKSIDFSGCNLTSVSSTGNMFNSCSALESIDFSNCDFSNVTTIQYYMFAGCKALKEIKAIGCNEATIAFLKDRLNDAGLTNQVTLTVK